MKPIAVSALIVVLVISHWVTWVRTRNSTILQMQAAGWRFTGPVERYGGPDNEVITRRINEIRLQNGLEAYSTFSSNDKRRQETLARHNDICIDDNNDHDRSEGKYTHRGEVISGDKDTYDPLTKESLIMAVDDFLSSPTHKDILLDKKFTTADAWGNGKCLVVLFW